MVQATLGSFFTLVSAEEHRQIVEYSHSGNTKSKGVAKVPLKRPVRLTLEMQPALAHSAGHTAVATT